jgi:hypothetical protein
MFSKLSVEISEMIIDQVAVYVRQDSHSPWRLERENSLPALRACALTCSAWRPRAHYHLYTLISIRNHKRARRLLKILETHPDLAACVRTLAVHLTRPWSIRPDGGWEYHSSLAPMLVSLLSLFTNIDWIVFCGVEFTKLPIFEAQIDRAIECLVPSVRNLSFLICTFQDDSAFIEIIRRFTTVDVNILHIQCCMWDNESIPAIHVSPAPHIVPRALINELYSLSRPWSKVLSLSSLTALEVVVLTDEEVQSWQSVLTSTPLLHTLTISIHREEYERSYLGPGLDLRHLRQLETLHVLCYSWDYMLHMHIGDSDPLTRFLVLLSSTCSTKLSLAQITLDCQSDPRQHFDLTKWTNMTGVVTGINWAGFPKVVIELSTDVFTGLTLTPSVEELAVELSGKLRRDMRADWLHVETGTTEGWDHY